MRGGESKEEMMKQKFSRLVLVNLRRGHFQESMETTTRLPFYFLNMVAYESFRRKEKLSNVGGV